MKIIGHRGARGLSPENTIKSVEAAIKHGADEVEIDVHITKDGVAVLHHDPVVIDPGSRELVIRRTTYAELMRHKHDLAALDHMIRAVAHRARIMIEIKPDVPIKPVVRIIKDRLSRGWRIEEFSIASRSFPLLKAMKKELPDVELVVIERWSGVRASSRARRLGTKRISMNQRWLWGGYLRAAKQAGYQLSPYTVNSPRRAKRWRPYLYGIITDRPDRFERKKRT